MSAPPVLYGRSSSHFTRLARIFAHEAGLQVSFQPIGKLRSLEPATYGGHPALKLPLLRHGDMDVLGAENICRWLAEAAEVRLRVIWPEHLPDWEQRNAHEMVAHAMQAQVQLVFGLQVAALPSENIYFVKARAGLDGALTWLDQRLPALLAALPPRDLAYWEASLFCLLEHLAFRPTPGLSAHTRLQAFRDNFAERPSAKATVYRFDEA